MVHFTLWEAVECDLFDCVYYVFLPSHLLSKFDEKASYYIFVWYKSQSKGWSCCDPATGWWWTTQNMVFDKTSSWWFSKKKKELPDLKELKIKWRRIVKIFLNQEKYEDSHDPKNDDIEHDEVQNLWKTSVHHSPIDDEELSAPEPRTLKSQLKRSKRVRKPNLRYDNAVVIEVRKNKRTWDI